MSGKKQITHFKGIVHTKWFEVYNDILKYDEVLDHDIDLILEKFMQVLADKGKRVKLCNEPSKRVISSVTQLTLNRLEKP